MAFIKVQKNNTYFKRFQVKFRRRREGKTDYYQRKRLILQRKNKYAIPKWRFVVRKTNARIICQVVSSTIEGDKVKTSSDSFELKKYGLTAGLSNYSAAYCTGLLCARRLLKKLDEENKAKKITFSWSNSFNLVPETTGEYVDLAKLAEKKQIEQRPFTCFLDLGLATNTVGNKVFAAMKGAVDGGLNIPHKDKVFPKAKEEKGGKKKMKKRTCLETEFSVSMSVNIWRRSERILTDSIDNSLTGTNALPLLKLLKSRNYSRKFMLKLERTQIELPKRENKNQLLTLTKKELSSLLLRNLIRRIES